MKVMRFFVTFFSCLVITVGCSNSATQSYILSFSGEGEHWKSSLEIHGNNHINSRKEDFALQYKDKNIKSIGEVSYKVEKSNIVVKSGKDNLATGKNELKSSSACKGCARAYPEDKWIVTVEWNGKSETFPMLLGEK